MVQEVDGILRTTEPSLPIPKRILLMLYAAPPDGLLEEEIGKGLRTVVEEKGVLNKNLQRLVDRDQIHRKDDGKFVLFGKGPQEAEAIIQAHSKN